VLAVDSSAAAQQRRHRTADIIRHAGPSQRWPTHIDEGLPLEVMPTHQAAPMPVSLV
jgi:hypothetical protein